MSPRHRRRTPLFEQAFGQLLRSASSWAELVGSLDYLHLDDNHVLHCAVLGSTSPVDSLILQKEWRGFKEIRRANDFTAFAYVRTFGKRPQRQMSGEFAVGRWRDSQAYVVVTVATPSQIRDGLAPLLETLYPTAVKPFLSQPELHALIRALQRRVQPDQLRIQEFTAKRRLRASARKQFESVRDWTDVDPESAFTEAKERNVWFSSVRFEVTRRKGADPGRWLGLQGKLSKYGEVTTSSGFDLVAENVLPTLTEITSSRVAVFTNRERTADRDHQIHPLQLTYDRPLLESTAHVRRLADVLRRFPHGTCTVLHGNPYLHVTLVDDVDLSSADIWVLAENNILVVPQLRASHGALKRIVNHIFENFGEGAIGEAKTA